MGKIFPSLFIIVFLSACNRESKTTHAFYRWSSDFSLTKIEMQTLSALHTDKIYLHYFDVAKDKSGNIIPQAVIKFNNDSFALKEVVPVVYIDNGILKNMDDSSCRVIASNMLQLVNSINSFQKLNYKELQFDCDWSESTRENYFRILEVTKKLMPANTKLSATIRLHQVKYPKTTGIPPVDRGVLMFYNMGSLSLPKGDLNPGSNDNSILNLEEGKKYIDNLADYSLSLDVALPLYSWAVVFRNHRPVDILHQVETNELEKLNELKFVSENNFVASSGFYYKSVYIQQDDIIMTEAITSEKLKKAANLLQSHLKKENRTIILFDLDEKNINRIPANEMETVYGIFD